MADDRMKRPLWDGRLSLEQQKKRAKELLRGVRTGNADACARFRAAHPRAAALQREAVQLTDAQHVLARENGFDSWPKLKARADALVAARAQMRAPCGALDTKRSLHVRCGSDIRSALRDAGFVGGFLEFADPFCQGPVRDLPVAELIEERAAFIASAYQRLHKNARKRLTAEYAALAPQRLVEHDEIVLWFEHDVYDQLILSYLLNVLAAAPPSRLTLVCVERVPAVRAFVGLGQLAPEVIRLLWSERVEVGAAHYELGRRVWNALTASSPQALHQVASSATPAIAAMGKALARHLRELPATRHGLSLTEQYTLELLAEFGPLPAHALFARLNHEREAAPFLGDLMYWHVLRELRDSGLIEAPELGDEHATWPKRMISLGSQGRAVLAGEADRFAGVYSRWLGGIQLRGPEPCWRWNHETQRPEWTSWRRSA
jgi:hypothetical protein